MKFLIIAVVIVILLILIVGVWFVGTMAEPAPTAAPAPAPVSAPVPAEVHAPAPVEVPPPVVVKPPPPPPPVYVPPPPVVAVQPRAPCTISGFTLKNHWYRNPDNYNQCLAPGGQKCCNWYAGGLCMADFTGYSYGDMQGWATPCDP